MANANLFSEINTTGEVTESMVLDTFMYTNPGDSTFTGWTIKEINDEMIKRCRANPENYPNGELEAALNVDQYIKGHQEFGNMVMHSHSDNFGDDCFGAYAAAFQRSDGTVYIACRGTGDGRWFDNGDAFAAQYSLYQRAASSYFDKVVEDMHIDGNTNLIVTGHSKGGNIAQFIALDSKHRFLVDKVYSIDGQGFSPEAVKYFKQKFGEDFYNKQIEKMYSICGDNDYVNVLGNKIISDDHTVYIDTSGNGTRDLDVYDMMNAHALFTENGATEGNLFNYSTGEFYPQTDKQRELALTAQKLSEEIMKLPIAERREICRALMSLLELKMGDTYKYDLLGRKATFDEYLGFFEHVDDIVNVLTKSEAGREFIDSTVDELMAKFMKGDHSDFARVAALAAYGFYKKHTDGVLKVVSGIGKVISGGAKVIHKIKNIFEGAVEKGRNFLSGLKDFCGGIVKKASAVKEAIKNSFDGAVNAIKDFIDSKERILLDESAFSKAIQDFVSLKSDISALKADVEAALTALHNGFDTPAGEVFMNSCRNNLLEPIDREEKVITHISETLQQAKDKYTSVFTDYEHLTQTIASCQ